MNLLRKLFLKFKKEDGSIQEENPTKKGADINAANLSKEEKNTQKDHIATRTVDIEKDRWWFLPHGKRKSGPFTLEELKRAYSNATDINKLAIRKDGDPNWVKWVNAKEVFPALADYLNGISRNNSNENSTLTTTTETNISGIFSCSCYRCNHSWQYDSQKLQTDGGAKCPSCGLWLPVADDALDRVEFVAAIDKAGGSPIVSGKDFVDAVQMIDKLEEFATNALNGSAKCRMQIPEVAAVLDLLYAKYKDVAGADLGTELVDMVYEKLYGVCPKCGIRSDGKSLYIILTARNFGGGTNIIFSGNSSGRAAFTRGLCRKEGCSSKEITLYWDSGTPQDSSTDLPWQWSTKAPGDYGGSKLFQNLRNSLPPIFAAVEQPGQDPVFILVDVEEFKWRGLLYLLFKHHKVYYSPENLADQSPQWETVYGENIYQAPVIGGQNLRIGIYAVEREALVSELCSVADIPPPLIKQVQASSPQGMLTVVYFCGMNLGVRYLSRDGKTDKSPPIELMF